MASNSGGESAKFSLLHGPRRYGSVLREIITARVLLFLVAFAAYLLWTLNDPIEVDRALNQVAINLVGRYFGIVYPERWCVFTCKPALRSTNVSVALIDDDFVRSNNRTAPTFQQYADIINELATHQPRAIVIDIVIQPRGSSDQLEPFLAAINQAGVPVILGQLPATSASAQSDPAQSKCAGAEDESKLGSWGKLDPELACAASAVGLVTWQSDQRALYYPRLIARDEKKARSDRSLAEAAYEKITPNFAATPAADTREVDLFVAWPPEKEACTAAPMGFAHKAAITLVAPPAGGREPGCSHFPELPISK